jgi:hypothetical protein
LALDKLVANQFSDLKPNSVGLILHPMWVAPSNRRMFHVMVHVNYFSPSRRYPTVSLSESDGSRCIRISLRYPLVLPVLAEGESCASSQQGK